MRSVPTFFLNNQFELIFHRVFPKRDRFFNLLTKSLMKTFFEDIFFYFCRFLEIIHLLNRVFHTSILSNAAQTIQFKDLAVLNYYFLKMHALGKILKLFHWVLLINVTLKKMMNKCTVCKKGLFLAHCMLILENDFFYSCWSKVLNKTIWDFHLEHAHIFLEIITLKWKVIKLKRFSSVTQKVSVKHSI